MTYRLEWNEKEVYCKFFGQLTGEELLECNNKIYGDRRFDGIRYQIFDMLDITGVQVQNWDVMRIAACDTAAAMSNPNVRCALVAKEEQLHQLSMVYQEGIDESPWEARSFYDLESARAWLVESRFGLTMEDVDARQKQTPR